MQQREAIVVIPEWLRISSLCVMGLVIASDLILAYVRPHVPKLREAAIWISFYVALALVFALLLYITAGGNPSGQFIAGWLTEYSLSIDNLFVFVIIMSRFSVPRKRQQGVLLVGIIIALVLRGLFILLGVALIDNFSWIFYIFGAFLLYTAVQQLFSNRDQTNDEESRVIRFLRRHIPITQTYDGGHLTTVKDGRRMLTPILVVFIAIGSTDLIFALDSIPAVFGITQDAFLVFAANVFALMGLRQLYFLLGHLIDRLAYLTYGVTAILLFIAVKLVFHAMHENDVVFLNDGKPIDWAPEFGTLTSLAVIVLALVLSVGASLIKLQVDRTRGGKDTPDAV
ncbi:MAG TPA: TerC/Alx family metal homeostasis membrane protein [Galbitalea sp.]|nr:TerC/Alx family metal homeostasis membrane protein [Galbitalea sp.]